MDAPAEFQQSVNEIFTELVNTEKLRFLVDDAALRTGKYVDKKPVGKGYWEHIHLLEEFASMSEVAGLMLEYEEIMYVRQKLVALGFLAGEGKVQPTEVRILGLLVTQKPVTVE